MLLRYPLRLLRHGAVGVVPDREVFAHAAVAAARCACIQRGSCFFKKDPIEGLAVPHKSCVTNSV
jgi:hypothetical protein